MSVQLKSQLLVLALTIMGCTSRSVAQTLQPAPGPSPEPQRTDSPSGGQLPKQLAGSISGTVVDRSGAVVAGARVKLTREDQSQQEVFSGDNGQFSFANIASGPFQLTITSTGFATQTSSGVLLLGEVYLVPQITLNVAEAITEVRVGGSPEEVAEEQIKEQEKQRVFGVVPNFYVTYEHGNAVPLTSKQKFELAWKTTVDPITFAMVGVIAGVQQAQNAFSGYGQGAEGYAKRYGASYADLVSGTLIGGAILPSLLKQDPRYFYKGSGSKRSRILYALASSVICKGDNGHWQANYSNIFGSLAAGGISNLYYPEKDRNGAGLTIETGLIGIGATAGVNVFQEFFVRKVTPNVNHDSGKP
ncbi:MAG: carboxypeptidase-like regulatory domain-containing protein [Acidobacteriia bacterium]|nr:carboxypeptidase-like regulatory domain-containing protein [Terriglobia bacterium]